MNQTGVLLNYQVAKTTVSPNENIQLNKKSQEKPFQKMLQNEKNLSQTKETENQVDEFQDEDLRIDETLSFLENDGLEEINEAFELLNMLINNSQGALSKLEFVQHLLGSNPSETIKEALGHLLDFQDTFKEIGFAQLPPDGADIETLNGILNNGLAKSLEGLTKEQKNAYLTLLNFGKLIVMSNDHVVNQKGSESVDQLGTLLLKWKDKLTTINESKQAFTATVKSHAVSVKDIGINAYQSQSRTDSLSLQNGSSIVASIPMPTKSADIPLNQTVMIGDIQLQTQQQSPVLALEKGGQAVAADEFMKAFESILSKANFTNQNGMQRLFVRLTPENLGTLQIELMQKDGQLVAKIIANSQKGKELLDSQIQGLRITLAAQGIDFDKIDFEQTQDAAYREESSQEKRRDEKGSQAKIDTGDQEEESYSDFFSVLEDSMINQEI